MDAMCMSTNGRISSSAVVVRRDEFGVKMDGDLHGAWTLAAAVGRYCAVVLHLMAFDRGREYPRLIRNGSSEVASWTSFLLGLPAFVADASGIL